VILGLTIRGACLSSVNETPYRTAAVHPELRWQKSAVRMLDWILVTCLCLLLGFGPLAFGAVQEWATATLEIGAALCVLLWAAGRLIVGTPELQRNLLLAPIAFFAAIVCVQLLSGHTAYWFATWRSALLWSAYGMIFFVTTQALYRTDRVRMFAFFFVAFGFLVALFSIAQQFTWNGKLYWIVPNTQNGWVYGPYVDHAHYAGLMEMLIPIPLVFAMMSRWPRPQRALFGFAALLMAGTIFLSQSLGGIVAFGAQMIFLAIIVAVRERSRRQILLLLVMGILLALWLAMLSPGGISNRIALLQDPLGRASAGDRIRIVKDSLRMMAARPVLGWGLGTFPVVYPSFRSFYTNFFVNAAHNDYVQITVETGVLGFALVCCFIVMFYRVALQRVANWRTDLISATTLAAIVGVTGILVHSLSDFNLQIPANAALFFALTAVATGHPSNRTGIKTSSISRH
jgi:O-antigen ligase